MATPWGSALRGLMAGEDRARQRKQDDEDRAAKAEMAKLQRDALLNAAESQRNAQSLATTQRAQRLATRRRLAQSVPEWAGMSDDELEGLPDAAVQSVILRQLTPKKKAVAFDNTTGKPYVYDPDNPEFPEGFVGPHQQPPQRNIDPLSKEGIAASAARAGAEAAATAPYKKDPNAKASRGLPTSAVDKLTSLDAIEAQAVRVRDAIGLAIKNNTDATGRAMGVIREPGWLMNMRGKGGKEGEEVRTAIANLFGTVAKERGGTALSASELDLLEQYIPNKNEDEGTAYRKAVQFIRSLQDIKKAKLEGYRKYGFGVDDQASPADQLEQQAGTITVNGKTFKVPD